MNLIVQKHLLGTEDISIRSAILRLSAAKTQTHAEKKGFKPAISHQFGFV